MPIVSGTKLGPYEIQSPLGAGRMGEVYRAAGILTDENFRKRFRKFAAAVFCSTNYRCG